MAVGNVGVDAALYGQFELLQGSTLSLMPTADYQAVQHQIGYITVLDAAIENVEEMLVVLGQLARLAHSNAVSWEAVVAQLWPDCQADLVNMRRYMVSEGVCSAVIGLEIACEDEDVVRLCDWLGSAALRDRCELAALPIFLTPYVLAWSDFSEGVLAYVASHTDPQRSKSRVNIKRVALNTPITNAERLQYVLSLARRGVALTKFPGLAIDVDQSNPSDLVDKIQQIFAVRHRCRRAPAAPIRLVNLTTDISDTTCQSFCMVISAIGASSSVRQISLDLRNLGRFDGSVRVAQLLAYALFSKDSQHTIRSFVLDRGTMSGSVVLAMQEVLTASDPLLCLFPHYAETISFYSELRLSASEVVLIGPDGFQVEIDIAKMRANLCQLRILAQAGEWFIVFVPAWGCARVHKSKAAITSARSTSHQIQELEICAQSKEEVKRSLSWLSRLGQTVSKVDIDGRHLWPEPVEVDLDEILAVFPSMKKIRLTNVKIDTLHRLIVDIGEGVPDVRQLHLSNVSVRDSNNDEYAVLKALGTPQHRMASTIVTLDIIATRSHVDQAKLMKAALGMLTKNRVLQSFELHIKDRGDDGGGNYEAMIAAFAAQSGVEVPLQTCLPHMLALMNVVLNRGLERDVLEIIFRLAGFLVHRHVQLRIRNDI